MRYKRIGDIISFADIAISKIMERINKVIKWKNIEAFLLEYYGDW